MSVLITGAAGFLGSHLTAAYLDAGCDVTGLDDFTTSDGENIAELRRRAGFTFSRCDVSETLPAVKSARLILHFASAASPVAYGLRPIHTLLSNANGLRNCCELAERTGARVVFASTSEIYGDPLEHPQRETYWGNVNSIGERSCYDEAKRFGEALATAYARERGVDARIVRIFNTYGPCMDLRDGRVVPTFIAQALAGKPLTVYGDGKQTRSLCYVDDLVRGIMDIAALERPTVEPVNLGNDCETTVLEIAALIAELCGVPLEVAPKPLPPDDPQRRCPDLARARNRINWQPRVQLREGLSRTIAWAKTVSVGAEHSALSTMEI